jgi:hypothetical protein
MVDFQETSLQRSTLTTAYLQTLQSNSEVSYVTYSSFPLGNSEDNSPVLMVSSSNAMCAGRDKYQRNLKLLVPFFEEPKLTLFGIQEEVHHFLISMNFNYFLLTSNLLELLIPLLVFFLRTLQESELGQERSINADWNLRYVVGFGSKFMSVHAIAV